IKGGFQSIMMVPLISENEVIGVLNIQSTQADAYTESDLRLAERVSSQVAGGGLSPTLCFLLSTNDPRRPCGYRRNGIETFWKVSRMATTRLTSQEILPSSMIPCAKYWDILKKK
ncbi:MAG: GAF domain-containing protein, partial [Deltaproteobacteria bacterium]|nr:GAF domain-containing protein [Deltaproteobacteria bacterium]